VHGASLIPKWISNI